MPFDGDTYERDQDQKRLLTQLDRVREIMRDKQWHEGPDLKVALNTSSSGVDARVRDLRKTKFGGWVIERQRVGDGSGTFRYRWNGVIRPPVPDQTGRVLTVVLEIKDTERAQAIWAKHLNGGLLAGCKVKEIHEGNALQIVPTNEELSS